jgi:hypothetical protein
MILKTLQTGGQFINSGKSIITSIQKPLVRSSEIIDQHKDISKQINTTSERIQLSLDTSTDPEQLKRIDKQLQRSKRLLSIIYINYVTDTIGIIPGLSTTIINILAA